MFIFLSGTYSNHHTFGHGWNCCLLSARNKREQFWNRTIYTSIYLYQFKFLSFVQLLTQEIFFDSCCLIATVIAKCYVWIKKKWVKCDVSLQVISHFRMKIVSHTKIKLNSEFKWEQKGKTGTLGTQGRCLSHAKLSLPEQVGFVHLLYHISLSCSLLLSLFFAFSLIHLVYSYYPERTLMFWPMLI